MLKHDKLIIFCTNYVYCNYVNYVKITELTIQRLFIFGEFS